MNWHNMRVELFYNAILYQNIWRIQHGEHMAYIMQTKIGPKRWRCWAWIHDDCTATERNISSLPASLRYAARKLVELEKGGRPS